MKSRIVIDENGNKFWMLPNTSIFHREDGPAAELNSGDKHWYINGQRHREDGPAEIGADGRKEWWVNDVRHREDGPAIVWANGRKEWWLNDIKCTERRYKQIMRNIKLKELLQ